MNAAPLIPMIRIFPDYGDFTHRIDYPPGMARPAGDAGLIPERILRLLGEWQSEFERFEFEDRDRPGAMLWIAFDLKGLKIAQMLKLQVGERARVIYLKPFECPFRLYDAAREILTNGEVVTLEEHPGWYGP